jgi:hypothetical protein
MDIGSVMLPLVRAAIIVGCAAFLPSASAAVLYESVDSKGVVTLSDVPPAPDTLTEERIRASDEAVQRASLQVDMAEHALAVARRPLWEPVDLEKLKGPRMTRADQERLSYYRKNLKVAQTQLSDLLRTKRRAEARTMTAEASMPIYGPSSPIYRH